MPRNNSYEEDLARDLRAGGRAGVREFLLGLSEGEDGIPLDRALKHTIKRMGISEFCAMTKLPMPNVLEFLKGKRKLKPETLDKYLKPFGLRTRLVLEKAS